MEREDSGEEIMIPVTLSQIVHQLLFCKYECEGGTLENNIMFKELINMAFVEGCARPEMIRSASGRLVTGICGECAHCKLFNE